MPDPAPILKRLREILSIPGDRVGKARRISSAIREGGFPWVGIYDGSGDQAVRLAWSPPQPHPPTGSVMTIPVRNAAGDRVGMLEAAGDHPFEEEDRRCLETCAEVIRPLWGV